MTARLLPVRRASREVSFQLARVAEIAACALIVVVTVLVLAQVLFRYVLQTPLSWSEELARYTGIWAALIGAAVGLRSHAHFRVVYFLNLLPVRLRTWVDRLGSLILFGFLVAFFVATMPLLDAAAVQKSAASRIPLIWVYAALPVSTLLMITFLVLDTIAGDVRPLPSEIQEPDAFAPEIAQPEGVEPVGLR